MTEKTLQIRGMTCAACASSIEKVLNKLDGVEEANVNLALERTTVVYDPEVTNVEELKETVRDIGYGVGEQKIKFDVSA